MAEPKHLDAPDFRLRGRVALLGVAVLLPFFPRDLSFPWPAGLEAALARAAWVASLLALAAAARKRAALATRVLTWIVGFVSGAAAVISVMETGGVRSVFFGYVYTVPFVVAVMFQDAPAAVALCSGAVLAGGGFLLVREGWTGSAIGWWMGTVGAAGAVATWMSFLSRRARAAAERTIREGEARLREALGERDVVLENALVGIAFARERKLVWANRRMEELFGYAAEEMLGRSTHMLYPSEETYERIGREAYSALAQGKDFVGESHMKRKDGSIFWIRSQAKAIDPHDVARGSIWILDDITTQKEMELKLRESEERYRSVVSTMAEGVILRHADGTISTANGAAERILGLTVAQMQGGVVVNPAWPMVREDGSPVTSEEHPAQVTLRTGKRLSGAVVGVMKPGGVTWISVNSEVLRRSGEETPTGVVTTFSDVTEMKRQQDLARESQRQLALVLAGSNDGFWDMDLVASRFTFSPRCFEIIGENAEGVMTSGRYWWGRVHPGDLTLVRKALESHVRGQTERIDVEYRLRDTSGNWKWVRAVGMAVERDGGGRPTRLAGTLRDLTSRRKAQEELVAALRENEKLVGELREALQNVKTLSGLLPVCAWCHQIRNDAGYWQKIESYVAQHTDAQFTHGLCPDCYAKQYPDDPGTPEKGSKQIPGVVVP